MTNSKQRMRNRATAAGLSRLVRQRILLQHTCEHCGQPGGHWISTRPTSLQAMITGVDDQEGFWTCTAKPEPVIIDVQATLIETKELTHG